MKLFKILAIPFLLLYTLACYAGIGGGSGNETGGFGSDYSDAGAFASRGYQILEQDVDGPIGGGPGGGPILPPAIPLDGGASILIAIGLGLGGRKIYKKVINP